MNLKTNFVAAWFAASYLTLIFSIFLMFYVSFEKVVLPDSQNFKLYAAIPQNNLESAQEVEKEDARAKIIEDFFVNYKAPLAEYAAIFVIVADKYGLDYKLLPSIAMQESNGGKKIIQNSNNPFGYGIYGNKVLKFNSFEESIERVGRGLKEDYLDIGLKNPTQIMSKYTPSSPSKGGTWAKGVSSFMEKLR